MVKGGTVAKKSAAVGTAWGHIDSCSLSWGLYLPCVC
jgi:hypothetical protein